MRSVRLVRESSVEALDFYRRERGG